MKNILLKIFRGIISPLNGKKQTHSFFNALYFLSIRGMNFSNENIFKNGEYNLLKAIKNHYSIENRVIVIFDVGANKGDYSLAAANLMSGYKVTIHAFEPMKETHKLLQSNIESSKISTIKSYNLGLGNKTETRKIFSDHSTSPLASLHARDLTHIDIDLKEQGETVQIMTLHEFCSEHSIQKIDLLKIDTEGNEYNVLKGAGDFLTDNKIDFIQFEFSTAVFESRLYFKDFFNLLTKNYRIYKILSNGLKPMPEYNPEFEIFYLANYLAVSNKITFNYYRKTR